MKSVLVCVLLLLSLLTQAQHRIPPLDTLRGKPYFILLLDGAQLHGRIVRQDTTMLTVRLVNKKLTYVEASLFDRISLTAPAPTDAYFQIDPSLSQNQPQPPVDPTTQPYVLTLLDGTVLRGTLVRRDSAQTVLRTRNLGEVVLRTDQIARTEQPQLQPQPRPENQLYTFTLRDGTTLQGYIVRRDSAQTVLRTRNLGEVMLRTDQIARLNAVGTQPEATPDNVTAQWLPYVPTAFTAEPGRWYYRNTSIFVNQVEYGASKNLSIGATAILIPFVYLFSANAKLTGEIAPRLRLGLSGQFVTAGFYLFNSFSGNTTLGIVQAIGTYGEPRRNLTLGLGSVVARGSFGSSGFATVGVMLPLSPKLLFVSQNTFLVGDVASRTYSFLGLLSGGLRINSKQHAFEGSIFVPSFSGIGSTGATFLISYQVQLPQRKRL